MGANSPFYAIQLSTMPSAKPPSDAAFVGARHAKCSLDNSAAGGKKNFQKYRRMQFLLNASKFKFDCGHCTNRIDDVT